MERKDMILLGLVAAALAAVVIYQKPPAYQPGTEPGTPLPTDTIGMSLTPNNASVVSGPAYMTYNAPWFFSPPVGNFLPSITAGQGNQTVNMPTNFAG